jgi:Tfp pilus assembly protein PilO
VGHGLKQERLFRQEKDLLAKQLNDTKLAEMNIQRLKASTKAITNQLSNLNRQIPEDAEIGTFLRQLDGLVKKRGVVLVSMQPQPAVKEKLYQKIPIRLSCKGPFVSLYYLLQDLDATDRLIIVEKMAIGKLEQQGRCLLDVTVLVFVRESQLSKVR